MYIQKMELMENATSVCLLQAETENGSLFPLVGKQLTAIDVCCFHKCDHLCLHVCYHFAMVPPFFVILET
jgi:hypothetical protein